MVPQSKQRALCCCWRPLLRVWDSFYVWTRSAVVLLWLETSARVTCSCCCCFSWLETPTWSCWRKEPSGASPSPCPPVLAAPQVLCQGTAARCWDRQGWCCPQPCSSVNCSYSCGSGHKEDDLTHAAFSAMSGNKYRANPPSPLCWYPSPPRLPPTHLPRQMHLFFASVLSDNKWASPKVQIPPMMDITNLPFFFEHGPGNSGDEEGGYRWWVDEEYTKG